MYNGCDEVSDFTFQTLGSAISAGSALLDQVILDGFLGNFDSSPFLISGCSIITSSGDLGRCYLMTPYGPTTGTINGLPILAAVADGGPSSHPPDSSQLLPTVYGDIEANVSGSGSLGGPIYLSSSWVTWTLVPEPSTALLLGIGLSALAVRREKR